MTFGLLSTKRKFVAKGVFEAEVNALFTRELAKDGYSGLEARYRPGHVEVIIYTTGARGIFGPNGLRMRQLISLLHQRFHFPHGTLEVYPMLVPDRGLNAIIQCESLRHKLVEQHMAMGLACQEVVAAVMQAGAEGCEIVVAGKLDGQHAKSFKLAQGHLLHAGHGTTDHVLSAVRHISLRCGVMGIRIRIMLPWHFVGRKGCLSFLPDQVLILEPRRESFSCCIYSENFQRSHPLVGNSAKPARPPVEPPEPQQPQVPTQPSSKRRQRRPKNRRKSKSGKAPHPTE